MEVITIAVPSRYRPEKVFEMLWTAQITAGRLSGIEARVYLDDDDPFIRAYRDQLTALELETHITVGPRPVFSQAWNEAIADGYGDIVMLGADDLRFRSMGWDTLVREAFALWDDRIGLVYGRDGHKDEAMATHPFVHRAWIETLGRFTPPMFPADYADLWLMDIAREIGRIAYVPQVFIEHMHVSFGKSSEDDCNAEKEERAKAERPVDIWEATVAERVSDAAKLREVMG